ncbi:DUF4301 family protein [Candidatus Nitronereus thalassa]|uniref:DUF4301 family protein n=1 Tax=Candidatus Nitronereus thalassa TaxID=3020898 RepID=A0ABU3KCE9_9BACT|nr:DUF4301 family protein [Candidatus Nitronereus thalassa]MDT7043978.1 DUF4301 family protein [Candidatus Nitronereus thalassa]
MNSTCKIDHMLTQHDRECIAKRGTSVETIEHQLTTFQRGIPFTHITKPCTIQDGITQFTKSDLPDLEATFGQAMTTGRVTKFVPASGAASRMFKTLLAICADSTIAAPFSVTPSEQSDLETFLQRLSDFAFINDLTSTLSKQGHQLENLRDQGQHQPILEALLHPTGLNYAKRPKGLLAFHRYPDHIRTPIEEHLIEATVYAKDANNQAQVHFTISPEHQEAVQEHIEVARQRFKKADHDWIVTCSLQKASSDTIAVDLNNQPFRDRHGNLLFRPGGHGALLTNVNELEGDIVFIKNIDNVVPDHLKEETYTYKRAIGGYLISIQGTLFEYLRQLDKESATTQQLDDMLEWAQSTLHCSHPTPWKEWDRLQRTHHLRRFFHRPIRVCGMVKNTGDPGGGPFWVQHQDGTTSLQIVESSQVDPRSTEQQRIFASSTHFNPVDMVCGARDYQGKPFDLTQYIDPNAGFISQKSYEGRELKALELPGLWNGGMAKWHTIFVEVPRHTFNPVKTVFDLLLPAHQPE